MEKILETKNLTFGYIKQPLIFTTENLELGSGVVFLFGEEHSGKTTFLELVCGMQDMYLGDISICGKPPKEATANITYLPSKVVALKNKTVKENLIYAKEACRDSKINLEETLFKDEFILPILDTKFKRLNAFQQAIFALKRAQIKDAKLVLIDVNFEGFSQENISFYAKMLDNCIKNAKNSLFIIATCKNDFKKMQFCMSNAKIFYKFDKIYKFDSFDSFLADLNFSGMAEYLSYKKYECKIEFTPSGYYLSLPHVKLKMTDKIIKPIETYFDEFTSEVDMLLFANLDISNISEKQFYKELKESNILLYDKLSSERLV